MRKAEQKFHKITQLCKQASNTKKAEDITSGDYVCLIGSLIMKKLLSLGQSL